MWILNLLLSHQYVNIESSSESSTCQRRCDKRRFNIHILMLQKQVKKMIQYSHTDVAEDDSVFTYWCYRRRFSIQKMIQYSYTDMIEDYSVSTCWCYRRWFKWFSIHILILQKMIQYLYTDRRWFSTYKRWFNIYKLKFQKMIPLRSMMNMYDDVPKLPMTYRDLPIICTIVVEVSTMVEQLPS